MKSSVEGAMDRHRRAWDKKAQQHFVNPADHDEVVKAIGFFGGIEGFRESGRRDVEEVVRRLSENDFDAGGKRALDLGCGIGRTAGPFAEFFGEVHGCDISPVMISKAEGLWAGIPNLHFDLVSGEDLGPYRAESFDFAYSNGVFEHLRRPVMLAVIKEISRVLRVGGRFALEFNSPRWVPTKLPVVHRSIYNLLLDTRIMDKIISPIYLRSRGVGDYLGLLPSPKFLRKVFSASHLQVDEISGEDSGIFWLYGQRV